MTRFLKMTGMLLGSILLLIVLAIILLVTLVSPNRFKPILIDQVMKNTGRELVVDGDLSWTFYPILGVKAGHMSLGNPAGFSQKIFAEFSNVTISVKLIPLFSGRVQSNGIALQGMNLNLVKKADGRTNWDFQKSTPDSAASTTDKRSGKFSAASMGLAVSTVDINDANVTWVDEQSKQNVAITHFNFHASDINLTRPIPVKTDFDFAMKESAMQGHVVLTSEVGFSFDKQLYSLRDVELTVKAHKGEQKYDAHVTGDVVADLAQQTLQWSNFKANLANLNVSGKMNVSELTSAPHATGHFDIEPFDLKALLKNIGQDNDKLQTAKDVDGKIDFSASGKSVNVSGLIKIDDVQADKIKLSKVNAKVQYQDGVVTLAPLTADFYQGSLSANSKINLNTPDPQIQLQSKLTNVQSGPLLQDLRGANQKMTLTGAANVDLQITTAGKDADTITKNLNGTSRFSLNNGVVEGVDIGYYIDSASSLISQHTVSGTNSEKTTFGTLTATATIQSGVITNNDLILDSPRFETKGKGTINLVSQRIDYALETSVKQSNISTVKNFSGVMIPIQIAGSLNSPSVRLDTSSLLKTAAKQQIEKHKEQIQQKIEEKIKEKLPEQAGQLLQNLLGH